LPGSYRLQWHTDDEGHSLLNDPEDDESFLKLEIFPLDDTDPGAGASGLLASFNFGLVEGIMVLALSKRDLELAVKAQPKHSEWSENEHDEADYYYHPDSSNDRVQVSYGNNASESYSFPPFMAADGTPVGGIGTGNATGCCSPPNAKTASGKKRSLGVIADPFGVRAALAKRQKTTMPPVQQPAQGSSGPAHDLKTAQRQNQANNPHPHRVYFQFVCNEVNAYLLVDYDSKHTGFLDFDADTGLLAAKGAYLLPEWFGDKPQSVSIFKVAHRPEGEKDRLKAWYEYDGRSWGGFRGSW